MSEEEGTVQSQADVLAKAATDFFASIGEALVRIKDLPASAGYEPLLMGRGLTGLSARALSHLVRRHAERVVKERADKPLVYQALRELAECSTGPLSRRRRAKELLKVWASNSLIETICEAAGIDDFKLVDLLQRFSGGDESVEAELQGMAAMAISKWKPQRGPRTTRASAAHEFLQEQLGKELGLGRYTYSAVADAYTDDASRATEVEFGLRRFDPRAAQGRRMKRA